MAAGSTRTTRSCLSCLVPTEHVRDGDVWVCQQCGREEQVER